MSKWPVAIVAIIILAGLAIWAASRPSSLSAPSNPPLQATSTLDILPGISNATYTNAQLGFSIEYPSSATSSSFDFGGFLPLTQTPVASFVLPQSMYAGTNLGQAGVYIGATTTPAIIAACERPSRVLGESLVGTTTIDGADFMTATSTGVGAGNIYEEKVFRTVRSGACLEIVEMLHSGNIGNYPPGKVVQFDHAKFSGILEAIVRTYRSL